MEQNNNQHAVGVKRLREARRLPDGRLGVSHGACKTRLYNCWAGMIQRCGDPNHDAFHNYGGRGIVVCKEWRNFAPYYAYIRSLLPNGETDLPKGMTIDRIDNNDGYKPGNIRIATRKTQARNKRNNRNITIDGVTQCLFDWCFLHRIRPSVVITRVKRGWDIARAIRMPPRRITFARSKPQ
jgi:hypothetical protein